MELFNYQYVLFCFLINTNMRPCAYVCVCKCVCVCVCESAVVASFGTLLNKFSYQYILFCMLVHIPIRSFLHACAYTYASVCVCVYLRVCMCVCALRQQLCMSQCLNRIKQVIHGVLLSNICTCESEKHTKHLE
jgi:hypothetical protein